MISKENLVDKAGEALSGEFVDINTIREILLFIHKLDLKDRKVYKDTYEKIGKKLFTESITLPEFNLNYFSKPLSEVRVLKKEEAFDGYADFCDKLRAFAKFIKRDFNLLSRCFLLKLGNANTEKTSYILLHDFHSKPHLYNKVNVNFGDLCKIYEVSEFIRELGTNIDKKNNYIVLLTLSSHLSPEDTIIKSLFELQGHFTIEKITLLEDLDDVAFFDTESDFVKIQQEISYLVSKDIKDIELTIDTEKVLKKLFNKDMCNVIHYKKLSTGFSGSIVLYVEPSGFSDNQPKYVVKVGGNENTRNKIKEEIVNYQKYVQSFMNVPLHHDSTQNCVAIKYSFASINGKIPSESFSDIYKKSSIEDLLKIVSELFQIDLFQEWLASKSTQKITFESYYKKYVKIEGIKAELKKIFCVSDDELNQLPLIKMFETISEMAFDSYSKLCHGDLHTQNFFIDSKENIFLIDFGDTGYCHSLIDYTTLECSIKFKHIPQYVNVDDLIVLEKELCSLQSFYDKFEFQGLKRDDLKKPFDIIKAIRKSAFSGSMFKSSVTEFEYLYSLFMITVRQIRYENLNQIYAIKSAETIGEKIIKLYSTLKS